MELTKLTKAELISTVEQNQAAAQQALNIANYFYTHLDSFDKKLVELNPPSTKKLPLLWLWKNRQLILEFITFIIDRIKEIKDKVKEINSKATPSNESPQ